MNKPSLRPYYSADNKLTIEPLGRPPVNISWLPQVGKKVELTDYDLQHFEKQVRITIRVANFLESLLQAWKYGDTPECMLEKISGAIVHATKTQMQTQIALLGQLIQLRRDLFLSGATATLDVCQELRHAPILEEPHLFPQDLLTKLDDRVKRSCESSIIMQTFRKTQGQRHVDNKPQRPWTQGRNDNQRGWGRSSQSSQDVTPISPKTTSPFLSLPKNTSPEKISPKSASDQNTTGYSFEPEEGWQKSLEALQTLADAQAREKVGGRLKTFWRKWRDLGAPKRVYNWFRKGYFLPFSKGGRTEADRLLKQECPDFLLSRYPTGSVKQKALDKIIATLLKKGAITEVTPGSKVVFNRVFLREKPPKPRQVSPEFRLIIDLTQINQFLKLKTFQMDTPSKIRSMVSQNSWATSLDFSDAYHHIPIRPDCHKYLAFQVGAKIYQYEVCPFGLSPIPQVFTSAMEPLKQHARLALDIAVFQYIDDWLLIFEEPNVGARKTVAFAALCMNLGLLVNLDKSELVPSQRITHLGIDWDFQKAWVRPAKKHIQNITLGANLVLEKGKAKVKTLESLRGKMVAVEKTTHLGRINMRMFQRAVTRALQSKHAQQWVKLPLDALEDLAWWSEKMNLEKGVPTVPPKPDIHVTTDASDLGWGAFAEGMTLQGEWSRKELNLHINQKELLAVVRTLTKWGPHLKGKTIQFWMDNITAVSYILRQGGTHSYSLTQTAKDLFQLARSLKIWISASYIPGALNVIADMQSRAGQVLKTEWTLAPETFSWVKTNNLFGEPQMDLFANAHTNQLQRYGSPCPDTNAELIDALTANWPQTILYAFPPTCIMDKVVVKIQQERPKTLLLLVAMNSKATWFPFVNQWATTKMVIPKKVLNLQQPHFKFKHPNPDTLCLTLFHITYQN